MILRQYQFTVRSLHTSMAHQMLATAANSKIARDAIVSALSTGKYFDWEGQPDFKVDEHPNETYQPHQFLCEIDASDVEVQS